MSNWHALHYNKIAKVLREKRETIKSSKTYYDVGLCEQGKERLLDELTLEFTTYFKEQDEGFDPDRFIVACGYIRSDNES